MSVCSIPEELMMRLIAVKPEVIDALRYGRRAPEMLNELRRSAPGPWGDNPIQGQFERPVSGGHETWTYRKPVARCCSALGRPSQRQLMQPQSASMLSTLVSVIFRECP